MQFSSSFRISKRCIPSRLAKAAALLTCVLEVTFRIPGVPSAIQTETYSDLRQLFQESVEMLPTNKTTR